MVACSLQAADDVDAALAKFRAAMNKAKSPSEQSAAILDLRGMPDEKTLAVLTPFVTAGAWAVRKNAIHTVAGFYDFRKKVVPILLNSLNANNSEPNAVAAALEALGKLEDSSVVAVVYRYFSHNNIFVARAAVQAVGNLPKTSSIEPLLQNLKAQEKALANAGSGRVGPVVSSPTGGSIKPDASIRKNAETLIAETNSSLTKITKQDFKTSADWQKWWDANKSTFKTD